MDFLVQMVQEKRRLSELLIKLLKPTKEMFGLMAKN
jgi:hypothetical protein